MNLWKYLLISNQDKEQGFTIPLILGFGLFMLAIGITSIKMSNSSEANSKVQKKTLQSVAAAELGLSRIQELLNTNRTIAVYNDCFNSRASDGSCPDTTEPSWSKASNITLPAGQATSCNSSGIVEESEIVSLASTSQWLDVSSSDPSKGQYRLIDYTYIPDTGISQYDTPGVGILVIEGRTNQLEQGKANPDEEVFNTGTTRLSVEIPIKTNEKKLTNSIPGLWMKFDNFANMGEQKVKGSILIEDADCSAGGAVPTQLTQAKNIAKEGGEFTGDLKSSPMAMPDTPALPPGNRLNKINGYEIFAKDNSLPRVGDVEYQGAYHYLVPSLETSGGSGIVISGSKKIVLYIQGNIDLNGSINDGVAAQNLQIYGNTTETGGSFKYGCDDVVAKNGKVSANSCPTQAIQLGGTADLNAFIHAPEAWACLNGGGSDASITGSLWVNQWTGTTSNIPSGIGLSPCTSKNTTVIEFDDTALPADSILSALQEQTITEPQLSPLTLWERVGRD
jgi:hypothetical protein